MTAIIEVSAHMCGPDALSLIQLLQENELEFRVSKDNPRIIHVNYPTEEVTFLIEDNFKEGWIDVTEEEE